ncbi:ANTAR domain-containing protein [Streptomyces sp. NPDC005329]|uniref:ANTAR domain-containing protein n=1 Tax=Streptomyces sp. NPDC005329 TaxID=3157034 RepID=UPI0033B4E3F9
MLRESQHAGVGGEISRAVGSHATVDRAIGVLIAVHGISPPAGLEVLSEVSQRTGIKLHSVAETLLGWALGQPLPEPVRQALNTAVQRHMSGEAPE